MTKQDNPMHMPTALTMEYRLPVYPVSRVKDGIAETGMGTVYFKQGRLTAYHRDLLDVVITYSEELRLNSSGEVEVIFDPPRIARVLGIDSEWRFQRRLLEELAVAVVSIKPTDQAAPGATFTVLAVVGETDMPARRKGGQFGTNLKKVVLSSCYVQYLKSQPTVCLGREVVGQVMRLRNQVSRTSAKWLLAGRGEQRLGLNELLQYAGCRGSKVMMSKYRRQLMDDAALLTELGVVIESGVVSCSGEAAVVFDAPFDLAPFSPELSQRNGVNNNSAENAYSTDITIYETECSVANNTPEPLVNINSTDQSFITTEVNHNSVVFSDQAGQTFNQLSADVKGDPAATSDSPKHIRRKGKKSPKAVEAEEQYSLAGLW
ncbi:MAG TPA: hypothetical protein PLN25_07750 [Deltaproteobacteria bacterium]|nr:hypothetical protein [Deltaproteobacteria bacterium]